jgi:hypothetical protein
MFNRHLWIYVLLFVAFLGSCSRPSSSSAVVNQSDFIKQRNFRKQVAQNINDTSAFGFSEAEVYLTFLGRLSDKEIFQYGERVCESVRRGDPLERLTEKIFNEAQNRDEAMPYVQIAIVAERQHCPESSLPQIKWQRSLFFLKERLNGGQPL